MITDMQGKDRTNLNDTKRSDDNDLVSKDFLNEIAFVQSIEESLPSGICVVDSAGRQVYVNPSFCQMLGWERDELINQFPPFIYWPQHELEKIQHCFTLTINNQAPKEGFELEFCKKSGGFIPVHVIVTSFSVDDNMFWMANVLDITTRKEAEKLTEWNQKIEQENEQIKRLNKELQQSRDEAIESQLKFRNYVENAPDGVIEVDLNGHFLEVNLAATHITGYTRAEMLCMSIKDLTPEEDREKIQQMEKDLATSGSIIADVRFVHVTGEIRWCALHTVKIDENRAISFVKNITARKKAEEALIENEERFRKLVENSPEALMVMDVERQCFVNVSNSAMQLFKMTKEELLHCSIDDITPIYQANGRRSSDVAAEMVSKALNGENPTFEWIHCDKEKNNIYCKLTLVRLPFKNRMLVSGSVIDITDSKKNEVEINKSNQRYHDLLHNLDAGVIVHAPDTSIISSNPKASELIGLSEDQLMGRRAISTEWGFLKANKEKLPIEDYPVNLIIQTQKEIKMLMIGVNRPATEDIAWFLVNGFPIFGETGELIEIVVSFIDITERKLAEEVLTSKILLMDSLDSQKDTILYSIAPDYRLLYFNKIFSEFMRMNYDADVTYGSSFLSYISLSHERNMMQENLNRALNGESFSHLLTYGEMQPAYFESFYNPIIDEQKQIIGATVLSRNITQRKQMEFDLIKAKDKAEESEQLKTAFLQNMSHEIRTPLNAISGFLQMLDKPDISPEKRKSFSAIIINSSNQLLSIVSDILTISAIETKQEKVNISSMNINNLIVDMLTIFKVQATNQNISLYSKQNLSDQQSDIYSDPVKITQILSNLLSNAMKFTHDGSIEFGYTLKSNLLEFYVKDTGVGIAAEQQEKIFERFRQADLSISKQYGGTGLGLSISKGFVELLGGSIWVESELTKGSTFFFTIPYSPVHEPKIMKQNAEASKGAATILIAEDVEINFLLLEELFNSWGCNTLHAKNGREAVDMCNANPEINLVFMDIKMPVLDGFSAAKLIKEQRPELPVIAQSGYSFDDEREKYGNTFDEYISKPFSLLELETIARKYITITENSDLKPTQ